MEPVRQLLEGVLDDVRGLDAGQVADYIPELARAAPDRLAVAVAGPAGGVVAAGDAELAFTIQSISKPFVFALALDELGRDEVIRHVGVEPSGEPFNAISLEPSTGRPANPLINAGAIATTALVARADPSARASAIVAGLSRFAGRELTTDEAVYASESATGHRNRALAHLLRSYRLIDGDPHDVVEARLSDGLGMHVFDEHEAIAAPRVAIMRDHAGGVRVTLDGELSFSGAERVLAQLRGIHVDIDAIPLTVDLRGVTQMHPAALAVVRQQVAALGGSVEIVD